MEGSRTLGERNRIEAEIRMAGSVLLAFAGLYC
jgi:hypothetical protein